MSRRSGSAKRAEPLLVTTDPDWLEVVEPARCFKRPTVLSVVTSPLSYRFDRSAEDHEAFTACPNFPLLGS